MLQSAADVNLDLAERLENQRIVNRILSKILNNYREEVVILKVALRYYASQRHHYQGAIEEDKGEKARAALKEVDRVEANGDKPTQVSLSLEDS